MAKSENIKIFRWRDVGSAILIGILFFFVSPYVRFNHTGYEILDNPENFSIKLRIISSICEIFGILILFNFVRSIRYISYKVKNSRVKDFGR